MSDENPTPEQPADGNAPAASEPSFSAADVERILAADREHRAASEPDDPVARFRATAAGTRLYAAKQKQAQPQGNSELSELLQIAKAQLALNVAAMKPPAPPPPPKPMSAREKLASTDENIWLRRGSHNQFTAADRQALVDEHAAELMRQGFSGDVEREARARAGREIVAAARKALANVRVVPGSDAGVNASFDMHEFLGARGRR